MLNPAYCNTQHSYKYWQKYNRKCLFFFLSQLFISAGIETFPVGPGQLQCSASAAGLGLRGQLHSPGRHAAIGPVPAPTPARPFLCQSGLQRVFHHQFGSPQCLQLPEPPRRDRGSHHASHRSPEHQPAPLTTGPERPLNPTMLCDNAQEHRGEHFSAWWSAERKRMLCKVWFCLTVEKGGFENYN